MSQANGPWHCETFAQWVAAPDLQAGATPTGPSKYVKHSRDILGCTWCGALVSDYYNLRDVHTDFHIRTEQTHGLLTPEAVRVLQANARSDTVGLLDELNGE